MIGVRMWQICVFFSYMHQGIYSEVYQLLLQEVAGCLHILRCPRVSDLLPIGIRGKSCCDAIWCGLFLFVSLCHDSHLVWLVFGGSCFTCIKVCARPDYTGSSFFLAFFSCFVVVVTVLVLIDMVPVKEIMGIGVNLGRKGSTYRYHHHHYYFGSP